MSDFRPRTRNRSGIVRHRRLKKSTPYLTAIKVLAATLTVIMVSGASVAAIAAWNVMSSFKPGIALENEASLPQINAIDGAVNLLLVGSDSRQGQGTAYGSPEETGTLNDVTMLLHISEDHSNVTVVSFPRDLFVSIPQCTNPETKIKSPPARSEKINTTLLRGGLACTVSTVEKLTGLSIPFAAEIQFNGVIEMSNALGGVPVCVGETIEDKYTGTFLEPGGHTLSGMPALQFLRTRYGVGDGSDLARISNQQVFLSSLVRTIHSAETLNDPLKLYGLAKAATNNMVLSNSLNSLDTMVSIAFALKDISLDHVVFVQYPGFLTDGGVKANEDSADILFNAIRTDKILGLSGTTGGGAILQPSQTETSPTSSATPENSATANPSEASGTPSTSTPTPPPRTAVLPKDVQGQTAGQQTCSKGRTLDNQ